MTKKPIVLCFVAYYLPGYKSGGPVRTIANMVEQLGDELDFWIVTSDRDSFDNRPYPNIKVNEWNRVGKAQVYYASPGKMNLGAVCRLIRSTPHDILYLNSFSNPRFTIMPLLARRLGLLPPRPVVLAPRGEFSPGAFNIRRWKKKTYLLLAQILGLYRNLVWQASSQHEAKDIQNIMGGVARKIHIAPDLPAMMPKKSGDRLEVIKEKNGPLRIVFLSRISPKKNLDFALNVLKEVSVPVEFNVYGLIDDEGYWNRCKEIISELPSRVVVKYHGVIDHETVVQVIAQHDLFFLPTRGENYGHAIFEALAAGVPVLISDQTPWQDLDQAGVGWVRQLEHTKAFKQVIEQLAKASPEEKIAQRKNATQYAQTIFQSEDVKKSNLRLFSIALNA
jgi:glycosyltransferase involved in cell wall biosynthesis